VSARPVQFREGESELLPFGEDMVVQGELPVQM
jgi:hypothetical protein